MDTTFATEINAINLGILTKLCSDYNLPFDEIVVKYRDFVPPAPGPPKKPKRVKAVKKPKRIEMVHNHKLGEKPTEPCRCCDIWGISLDEDTRKIIIGS